MARPAQSLPPAPHASRAITAKAALTGLNFIAASRQTDSKGLQVCCPPLAANIQAVKLQDRHHKCLLGAFLPFFPSGGLDHIKESGRGDIFSAGFRNGSPVLFSAFVPVCFRIVRVPLLLGHPVASRRVGRANRSSRGREGMAGIFIPKQRPEETETATNRFALTSRKGAENMGRSS